MQSKTLKIISSLLLGIILLVVMTGCGNSDTTVEQATGTATSAVPADTTATTTEPTPETVTVTDSSGREVTVKLPVERVSYLHPTVAEGLRIIDAWDRVVSVDNYTTDSILFPGFTDMPVITYTESGDVDYEAIIELKPDVLLVLAVGGTIDLAEVAANLEPEITVIGVFDTYDADTWTEGIELLGTILQQENEAREFIEFANAIENNISTRTAAIPDEKNQAYS
jgi:iron complex transport system substrate-binding protein